VARLVADAGIGFRLRNDGFGYLAIYFGAQHFTEQLSADQDNVVTNVKL
jgi:hypothetical protein